MDEIMNKVGTYWLGQRANKEISSAGDDIDVRETKPSYPPAFILGAPSSYGSNVGDGAKWLVNKLKGKMQKPLPDLLKEHGLPVGLFPREATNYELDPATQRLTVHIPSPCEVGYRDGSELRFDATVTGTLGEARLTEVEGIKTKVLVWARVTAVKADAVKVHFTAGIKRSRTREAYEVVRGGITVDEF
ncbi:hypothetical protein PR202_ga26041 [Eleusine coracana subsp. coracana]|uniref:DUF538 family protein n=1 Tax=Eleusine coracana subsp. coracana TaxID=191504 RepID=A0AAV5DCK1_ELECO|nr:hypothetical protein PR202_ga26041 [Eleusine coracana subsp. coracana]